jgi:REP element-mobilizing transposase RayT
MMPRRDVELVAGKYYHFYNRGNNRGRIFFEQENDFFFLRRLRQHLLPALDVVAYCLMPTHYHLVVQIRIPEQTSEVLVTSEVAAAGVSTAMMRFSVSYTKAMNKRYDRVGSLFQGAFQAKRVDSTDYLIRLSRYIHLNPVLAGYTAAPEEWEFSSYPEYLGLRDGTLPMSEVVLAHFASREAYQAFVEDYTPEEQERIATLLFD